MAHFCHHVGHQGGTRVSNVTCDGFAWGPYTIYTLKVGHTKFRHDTLHFF